ncbi:hypothetical protein CsSME_00021980 [Camellia sinensis var. sinensis]|uniref:cinnamoyl-CoA reductase 2-like isoform X1 n=1 Tax=Camellia sinensis TaxID=4442 RepID=UPI001036579F|nr:cinnamoyl-CoA reductase 2-like isoform X1 [Camellia sinensis]XP_028097112.1 cinnamoyl-CoA reductase 2-like isoform X2 [Camellia sinensis]
MTEEKERVCVTGAGAYVASWVVKFLLSKGYFVHGTVRDPCNEEKNGHLKKLENATENLKLFKTDMLEYEGLCSAIVGCTGVIHLASPTPFEHIPIPNPEVEFVESATKGTRNVLNACLKAKVKKVVVVSSAAAVVVNPNWPKDQPMDENCWSDPEFCKQFELWYCLGKTTAERETVEFGRRNEEEVKIITVCPALAIGPMLQSTINSSSSAFLNYFKGGSDTMENRDRPFVDVRDLAEALLLTYEKPEAQGRYICSSYVIGAQVLVEKLKTLYPYYNYPKNFSEVKERINLSSSKLQKLGWKFRSFEETLADAVKDYEEYGLLVPKH